MRVNVNETRCDDQTLGSDAFSRLFSSKVADGGDSSITDSYVGSESWLSGAIHYGSSPDDQLKHWRHLPFH